MDDHALKSALLLLHNSDEENRRPSTATTELAASCRAEIAARMDSDATSLGQFLSRLVRNAYLSEEAIEGGAGIEDACVFWNWFDQNMWPETRGRDRAQCEAPVYRDGPSAPRGAD